MGRTVGSRLVMVPVTQSEVIEPDRTIGEASGLLLIMGDEERRGSTSTKERSDTRREFQSQVPVQVAEGLIEEEHLGSEEGTTDGHTLGLPAREVLHGTMALP